jgi:surface protein
MSGMFCNCSHLTSIDLSGFDTSNVTNMSSMFYNCQLVLNYDFSSFDTSNVTDMSNMFYFCKNITTMDLSTFTTEKLSNTDKMFYECNSLTTIYVDGVDTQWPANMGQSMFSYCGSIVGGTGKTYSHENTSSRMARVQNGYFTAKTYNVTVADCIGGTVQADKSVAAKGETVTLTATADSDMTLAYVTVTDRNGNKVAVNGDTFTMPASDVTVTAVFREQGIYDINEDGVEDINDIAFIISACVGEVEMTVSQSAKADLNGDGAVDAFDAAKLDRLLF